MPLSRIILKNVTMIKYILGQLKLKLGIITEVPLIVEKVMNPSKL